MNNSVDELVSIHKDQWVLEGVCQERARNIKALYANGVDIVQISRLLNIQRMEVEKIIEWQDNTSNSIKSENEYYERVKALDSFGMKAALIAEELNIPLGEVEKVLAD